MYYADASNQSAGPKAPSDCAAILTDLGYRDFDVPIYTSKHPVLNLMMLLKQFGKLFFDLRAGDRVLLQYPLLGINKWLKYFAGLLRSRGCQMFCLVHDLDSLRQVHHAWTLAEEVLRLNGFDLVIVHNRRMRDLLRENGLKSATRCLELFDYLLPETGLSAVGEQVLTMERDILPASVQRQFSHSDIRVAFAGNLGKSNFLNKLDQVQGVRFKLYGPGFNNLPTIGRLEWGGNFDADELPAKLQADFGLIWDGADINACTGHLGEYLKYNNPHKASLYLLAGIPLIAPKQSAIAEFIHAHGVGITVDTLADLSKVLRQIHDIEYYKMRIAIRPISRALASGTFLKQALLDF